MRSYIFEQPVGTILTLLIGPLFPFCSLICPVGDKNNENYYRRQRCKILSWTQSVTLYNDLIFQDNNLGQNGTLSSIGYVNITVINVNDQPPYFVQNNCPRPCIAPPFTAEVSETYKVVLKYLTYRHNLLIYQYINQKDKLFKHQNFVMSNNNKTINTFVFLFLFSNVIVASLVPHGSVNVCGSYLSAYGAVIVFFFHVCSYASSL